MLQSEGSQSLSCGPANSLVKYAALPRRLDSVGHAFEPMIQRFYGAGVADLRKCHGRLLSDELILQCLDERLYRSRYSCRAKLLSGRGTLTGVPHLPAIVELRRLEVRNQHPSSPCPHSHFLNSAGRLPAFAFVFCRTDLLF